MLPVMKMLRTALRTTEAGAYKYLVFVLLQEIRRDVATYVSCGAAQKKKNP